LFVYRFNTGTRRQAAYDNRQIADILLHYLKDKYAKDTPMGCGCRGKGPSPDMPVVQSVQGSNPVNMNDSEFVLARYLHPNKGSHSVYGPATKQYYGQRSGGDTFLVHNQDIALAPMLFQAVEGSVGEIKAPAVEVAPLEEPIDLTIAPKRRGRPPKS
jgi:hypothetical protein